MNAYTIHTADGLSCVHSGINATEAQRDHYMHCVSNRYASQDITHITITLTEGV